MSRTRRYQGVDLSYSDWHREALPAEYVRIGHRADQADRDWTEFCHWCKEPIALVEEVRDVGQNLKDKATTVTRRLAERSNLDAFLMAWRCERPLAVQLRIDGLYRQIRDLEQAFPITGFRARWLAAAGSTRGPLGPLVDLTPGQWVEHIMILHRRHHQWCYPARANNESAVRAQALADTVAAHPLWPNSHAGQVVIPLGVLVR